MAKRRPRILERNTSSPSAVAGKRKAGGALARAPKKNRVGQKQATAKKQPTASKPRAKKKGQQTKEQASKKKRQQTKAQASKKKGQQTKAQSTKKKGQQTKVQSTKKPRKPNRARGAKVKVHVAPGATNTTNNTFGLAMVFAIIIVVVAIFRAKIAPPDSTNTFPNDPVVSTTPVTTFGKDILPQKGEPRRFNATHYIREAIHDAFKQQSKVALVGPAGSGKSTVLANYLDKHLDEYAKVILIDASDSDTLVESFMDAAKDFGLDYAQLFGRHRTPHKTALEVLSLVRAGVDRASTRRILVVYENFRYTSENSQYKNWMEVLKSTNSESHTLLLSRTYSDIRKIDFSSNSSGSLPSYIISVPDNLHKTKEFPAVVAKLLPGRSDCMTLDSDRGHSERLYALTEGLPLAVEMVAGSIRGLSDDDCSEDSIRDTSDAISDFEKKKKLGINIYNVSMARLDNTVREALQCIAQFEADDLPESLVKAAISEVLGGDPDRVESILRSLEKSAMLHRAKPDTFRMHRLVQDAARACDVRGPVRGNGSDSDSKRDIITRATLVLWNFWVQFRGGGSDSDGQSTSVARAARAIENVWRGYSYERHATWPLAYQLVPHLRRSLGRYTADETVGLPKQVSSVIAHNFLSLGEFVHRVKGDYNQALEYYNKMVRIYRTTSGEGHVHTATAFNRLGAVHYSKGEYDQALDYFNKALEIRRTALGDDHVHTARTYKNLGLVHGTKSEYNQAIEYYNMAVRAYRTTLGEDHVVTARAYNSLGDVHSNKGEYDRAIGYYNKAMRIYHTTLGEGHSETARNYNNLGDVHYNKGEYDQALDYFSKALSISRSTLGEDHAHTATNYNNVGVVHHNKGEYDQAFEYYSKALRIRRSTLGENHAHTARTFNNLDIVSKLMKRTQNTKLSG